MKNIVLSLIIIIGCALSVNASGSNDESQESLIKRPYTINKNSKGEVETFTFSSKEELEAFWVKTTRTEEFNKIKPDEGENIIEYLTRNPEFVNKCRTRFALVKENSYGYWDHMSSSLPNKTFTVEMFVDEMNRIKNVIKKEEEKKLDDDYDRHCLSIELDRRHKVFFALLGVKFET